MTALGSVDSVHGAAQHLMRAIAPAISGVALGFVSRLEAMYLHPNTDVRVSTYIVPPIPPRANSIFAGRRDCVCDRDCKQLSPSIYFPRRP